jgi:hypothetical protein
MGVFKDLLPRKGPVPSIQKDLHITETGSLDNSDLIKAMKPFPQYLAVGKELGLERGRNKYGSSRWLHRLHGLSYLYCMN